MSNSGTGGAQNIGGFDECEAFFCDERAEWLFTDDVGGQTAVCHDCALEFPNDMLRPIFHGDTDAN